jgi:hypothetical protein
MTRPSPLMARRRRRRWTSEGSAPAGFGRSPFSGALPPPPSEREALSEAAEISPRHVCSALYLQQQGGAFFLFAAGGGPLCRATALAARCFPLARLHAPRERGCATRRSPGQHGCAARERDNFLAHGCALATRLVGRFVAFRPPSLRSISPLLARGTPLKGRLLFGGQAQQFCAPVTVAQNKTLFYFSSPPGGGMQL